MPAVIRNPPHPLATILTLLAAVAVCSVAPALAQSRDPMGPPQLPPPPLPSESERKGEDWKGDRERDEDTDNRPGAFDDGFLPDFDGEWGLSDELLVELASMSKIYADRATGFTAIETARTAKYDAGEAGKEQVREYAYILRTGEVAPEFGEIRNKIG